MIHTSNSKIRFDHYSRPNPVKVVQPFFLEQTVGMDIVINDVLERNPNVKPISAHCFTSHVAPDKPRFDGQEIEMVEKRTSSISSSIAIASAAFVHFSTP